MSRVVLVLVSFVVFFSANASAQSTELPPDREAEINARRLFNAGESAYDAERYDAALEYFEEAYRLVPLPTLLYNIGVTAERAGRLDRAIEALEAYLRADESAPNRAEVEGRLRVLRSERNARIVAPEAVAATTEVEPTSTPSVVPDDADESDGTASALGWTVLGVSAASTITGAVLLGLGARDYATVEDAPDGTTWSAIRDAHDRAPRLSNAGIVCGAVGLVGVATGLVLVVTRDDHDDEATAVGVTSQGFFVRGTF